MRPSPTTAAAFVAANAITARAATPAIDRRSWLRRAAAGLLAAPGLGGARAQPSDADTAALTGPRMPYAAFDRLPTQSVAVTGGVIRIGFGAGEFALPREHLVAFVSDAARSVSTYYGRFPSRDTRLLILGTDSPGRAVRSGTAFGYGGAAIRLVLARSVSADDLERDWILVHEMTHLALPSLPRRQHWLEEGIATYVEPLARAQAGRLSVHSVWAGMLKGMPLGQPEAGDRGLDFTPTWGRTYWGGALFCLLADVAMRERSANGQEQGHGLQHALRAILAHANMEHESAVLPLLRIGDAAVGLPVLSELYERMKDEPSPVDLAALWQRLGVRLERESVVFDDRAPLAALRRAMTAPLPG